eukprot:118272-Karenia_brevis.AAC.1
MHQGVAEQRQQIQQHQPNQSQPRIIQHRNFSPSTPAQPELRHWHHDPSYNRGRAQANTRPMSDP